MNNRRAAVLVALILATGGFFIAKELTLEPPRYEFLPFKQNLGVYRGDLKTGEVQLFAMDKGKLKLWTRNSLPPIDNPLADPHFSGFMARVWFNALGGATYSGAKVPVQKGNDGHWRTSVFGDELMISGWMPPYQAPLSDVTLSSMRDIGYEVNWNAADRYRVPRPAAKPVVVEATPRCRIARHPIHVVADDGRVLDTIDP